MRRGKWGELLLTVLLTISIDQSLANDATVVGGEQTRCILYTGALLWERRTERSISKKVVNKLGDARLKVCSAQVVNGNEEDSQKRAIATINT